MSIMNEKIISNQFKYSNYIEQNTQLSQQGMKDTKKLVIKTQQI